MPQPRASLSTKVHVACDALGDPLGFILTAANVSDFDQASPSCAVTSDPTSIPSWPKDTTATPSVH